MSSKEDKNNCFCSCGINFEKENVKCSDHLKNWEIWMQRRKKIHALLGKLGRAPGELIMNIGDEYRNIKEDRLILGYRDIETHFDKFRGNPVFWTLPTSLKSRIPPYGTSEYFTVQTKEEINEIPIVEYVGVPDHILEEKNIMPRTRNIYTRWNSSNNYRQEIMKSMASKLSEIEPHRPEFQNLVIVGKSPNSGENENNKTVSAPAADPPEYETNTTEKKKSVSLKINNIEFDGTTGTVYQKTIDIVFQYFTDSSMPCRQSILFENTGQTTIHLFWTQFKPLKIFRERTLESKIYHPFKFSKNEILLLPGQKLSLHIDFKAINASNYFEYWEIRPIPKIWSQDYHVIFALKGFTFSSQDGKELDDLNQKIQEQVRNSIVKDLISDMLLGKQNIKPVICSYIPSQKELFESINQIKFIVFHKPKYLYSEKVIAELSYLYEELEQSTDSLEWDLSIKKLREKCRIKDLTVYFDNCLDRYRRKSSETSRDHSENPKQQIPDNKSLVGKPSSKPLKELTQIDEEPCETTFYYDKLKNLIDKLTRPSILKNERRTKCLLSDLMMKTYLCKMLDKVNILATNINGDMLTESSNELHRNISIVDIINKLINNSPDRLVYEIFDESFISRCKRVFLEPTSYTTKQKSILLKDISTMDSKKIYKIYFNKPDQNEKEKKNKNQNDDKGSKKPINKSKNVQGLPDLSLEVKEYFNPFEKVQFGVEVVKESKIHCNLDMKDDRHIKNYHKKYLCIYTLLCNAVDDLAEIIDSFEDSTKPSGTSGIFKVISEDSSLKQMRVDIDDEYFKFVLEAHLADKGKTDTYFVKGVHQDIIHDGKKSEEDVKHVFKAPSNIFSLEDFRRKPFPRGYRDFKMQTVPLKTEDLKSNSNPKKAIDNKESLMKNPERSISKNLFYFLDDTCNGKLL